LAYMDTHQNGPSCKMKNQLVVLLYHDIAEDGAELPQEAYLRDRAVTLGRFREQMGFLVDEGYQSLTLEQYFECREGARSLPKKSVIITFDDGLRSHYELAFPVLREFGLQGTFFVVGNRIDKEDSLSCSELEDMTQAGMEIASHGFTHTFLAYLSKDEVAWELAESKRVLERATGGAVNYFAYPGGHYKRWMFPLLQEAGYRGACSCRYGWVDKRTNPFLLRRIDIRQRMDINAFAACFNSNNMRFYRFVYLIKSLVRGVVGRKGYTRMRRKLYRFYRLQR